MDVVDFFVITELGVYHTHLYVMDIHHAVMDLMKQIVVRYLYRFLSVLNLQRNFCILKCKFAFKTLLMLTNL